MASLVSTVTSLSSDVATAFDGPHPSVIMWSTASKVTAATSTNSNSVFGKVEDAVNGVRDKLNSVVSGSSNQEQLFNTFKFDAVVSEEHESDSVITKFPTSNGVLISDHMIKQNRVLMLTAVAANMQNSSMWSLSVQGASVLTGAIFNSPIISTIGGLYGVASSAFESNNRVRSTFQLFNSLKDSGTLLYISTIAGTYLNCVIRGIRTKHDKNTQAILAIQLIIEELQMVGNSDEANSAAATIESSRDYSNLVKLTTGFGISAVGGGVLPGLGSVGDTPAKQLATLKDKVAKLTNPLSSVKGLIV